MRALIVDDERLARLIQTSVGFEQIERARIFLETYADSPFRPATTARKCAICRITPVSPELTVYRKKKP